MNYLRHNFYTLYQIEVIYNITFHRQISKNLLNSLYFFREFNKVFLKSANPLIRFFKSLQILTFEVSKNDVFFNFISKNMVFITTHDE
jgi:hypothetical protein